MRFIDVEVSDGRHYTLTADRPWTLMLVGEEFAIVNDEPAFGEPTALGAFVHFGDWVFRSTQHRGLSRLQINGAPVAQSVTIRLPGQTTVALVGHPEPTIAPSPTDTVPPTPAGRLAIGRAGAGADLEIDDPTLLARHAELRRSSDGEWVIVAKHGAVFVNGVECSAAPIGPHDTVIIGQSLLHIADIEAAWGNPRLVTPEASVGGLSLRAVQLSVRNGRRPTLFELDFRVAPGSLVAVVGPSGAGKSTLMGAILGGRHITGGELRVGDVRLRPGKGQRLLRHLVRFVPQKDSLHGALTVAETLDGAARLRLARDASSADRASQVTEVLTALGLEHRRHARVDRLSGGERRRVSIGVELIGRPRLLLLDEPTSGLDLALECGLMRTLRQISRTGCTVVVITHSVAHIVEADQVLVLDAGGHLAKDGKPLDLVPAAGDTGWTDLLEAVSDTGTTVRPPRRPRVRVPQVLIGRQCTVLLRRGPLYAAGMLALPSGGALVAAAAAPGGLRTGPNLTQALAILVTVAALSGTALTYLDLVTEEGVFKRDWRAGVHPGRIIATMFSAYATVCAGLAIVMAATFLRTRDGFTPAFAVHPTVSLLLMAFLLLVASMAIGILISAAVRTVPQAVTANTIVAIAQVVLNGSLFHLPGWLAAPASVLPARLGLAAAAGYADLNSQRRGHLYTDALWQHTAWRYWALLAGLLAVTAVALTLATAILQARWWRTVE